MSFSINVDGFGSFGSLGHEGSAPSPFDALDGPRLAGPQGSHPLHGVRAEELVRPSTDAVAGEIVLDRPAMVGEGITGTLRIRAVERVGARRAALRLVGLRLDEVERSRDDRDSEGRVTHSEHGVETSGKLFVEDAYLEPAIPAALEPGQSFEARFAVPAPAWGRRPPTSGSRSSPGRSRSAGTWRWAPTTSSRRTCRWPSTPTCSAPASERRAG